MAHLTGDAPKIQCTKVQCSKMYAVSIFLSFTQQNYLFTVLANNDYLALFAGLREIAKLTVVQMPDKKDEIIESFKQESAYIRSRNKDYDTLRHNLRMMGYHCARPVVIREESEPIGTAVFYSYK